ncbi:PP2C family protein-serine/threonine phosphatase [Actinobacillus capsulatus]|uniref:PP2C family protein-serine/threonine phosphatase n=1 Tax=Actinobacillus capsulatus TaxID=717 RepID=UPI000380BDAB|nr:protein phosphatase 2C domain-containing protein [Actinobacillus capsulatus]
MIIPLSTSTFSFPRNSKKVNQDAVLSPVKVGDGYLFAIADGVGGYLGGELASNIAISYLREIMDPKFLFNVFKESLNRISKLDSEYKRASTTLTFAYLDDKGLQIGHIGDCRLYIKDGNKLRQKTKDHTSHQKLLDEKIYTKKELACMDGKNVITTAISTQIDMNYDEIFIPINELKDHNNEIFICIMSDGSHHDWSIRPRFSDNTMNNTSRFAAALRKRIEKNPKDDYSLIYCQFKLE